MRVALAALVPLLVVASGFASAADGRAAGVTRVVIPVVAGLGCLPIAFFSSRGRGFVLGLAIVLATCAGAVLASAASRAAADYPALVACILATFAALFGLVSPLVALGWRATAAVGWLGAAAAACGSVSLVKSGSIPAPLLVYNPIVRVMRHALSYDWLHAANMYPRPGGLPYASPAVEDGLLVSAIVAGSGLLIAGMIALTRHRRPATP